MQTNFDEYLTFLWLFGEISLQLQPFPFNFILACYVSVYTLLSLWWNCFCLNVLNDLGILSKGLVGCILACQARVRQRRNVSVSFFFKRLNPWCSVCLFQLMCGGEFYPPLVPGGLCLGTTPRNNWTCPA